MKQKIEIKIMDIEQKMEAMHKIPFYYLTEQWHIYVAQVDVLKQLLNEIK